MARASPTQREKSAMMRLASAGVGGVLVVRGEFGGDGAVAEDCDKTQATATKPTRVEWRCQRGLHVDDLGARSGVVVVVDCYYCYCCCYHLLLRQQLQLQLQPQRSLASCSS